MPVVYLNNLNFGRFEVHTETPQIDFLSAKQVHGVDIVSPTELPCEADGLIVLWKDLSLPLAIKTADCLPVVIEGEKGVVALHAGWRGLARGILKREEVERIKPIRAFIGPSIHACCFEVSPDFTENFPQNPRFTKTSGKLYFNLQQEAKAQLQESFPNLLVEISPICTSCNLDYHSYRRDKSLNERNWNLYIKG